MGSRRPWGWRKTILEDAIKGFFEIYKVNVQLSLQFCALLIDVSQGVYLFNASLPFQNPLARWIMIFARILLGTDNREMPLQLLQYSGLLSSGSSR